jgi:gas vesicle protein
MAETSAGGESRPVPPAKAVPAYPDERLGNFVRGFLLGALAGGVAAVLRAERSGDEVRAALLGRVTGVRESVADLMAEARTGVTDFAAWAGEQEARAEAPAAPVKASVADLTLADMPTQRMPATDAPTTPLPKV